MLFLLSAAHIYSRYCDLHADIAVIQSHRVKRKSEPSFSCDSRSHLCSSTIWFSSPFHYLRSTRAYLNTNAGQGNQASSIAERQCIPLRIHSCFCDTDSRVAALQYPLSFILFFISPPLLQPPLPFNLTLSHLLFPHLLHFFHHSAHFLAHSSSLLIDLRES